MSNCDAACLARANGWPSPRRPAALRDLVGGGLRGRELARLSRVDALLRSVPRLPVAVPPLAPPRPARTVPAETAGPSDEALLAGLAEGAGDAAAAFMRRFQARVYGLALTIVRDRGVAEDVAQETFVRAWRHAATYDPRRGRVATWLLAIARNLAIDEVRRRTPDPVEPDAVTARIELAPLQTDPVSQDTPPDERERVRAAIAALPDEQRRALVFAAYLGRTAQEISELDGVALGTVKWRIRTAMRKLRDELREPDDA